MKCERWRKLLKRIFSVIICFALVLSVTACGKKSEPESNAGLSDENHVTQEYVSDETQDFSDYSGNESLWETTENVSVAQTSTKDSQLATTTEKGNKPHTTQGKPTEPKTTVGQANTTVGQANTTVIQQEPSPVVTSSACSHKNTVIKGKRSPTTQSQGYTGDTYCSDCGALLKKGEIIAPIENSTQTAMVQYPCPDGSTITVPVGTNVFDYTMKKANKSAAHDFYGIEKQIADLFNEERARLGISAVIWNEDAYYYVKTRSTEIQTLFSHTRPGGDDFSGVYTEQGIILCAMAENIVGNIAVQEGEDIAYRIFNAVMNSPSHKAAALDPRFNQMCLSLTFYNGQYYFCQHMYENVVH